MSSSNTAARPTDMWTIYVKELLELLRDRKTFIFTIFIPIFALPSAWA